MEVEVIRLYVDSQPPGCDVLQLGIYSANIRRKLLSVFVLPVTAGPFDISVSMNKSSPTRRQTSEGHRPSAICKGMKNRTIKLVLLFHGTEVCSG